LKSESRRRILQVLRVKPVAPRNRLYPERQAPPGPGSLWKQIEAGKAWADSDSKGLSLGEVIEKEEAMKGKGLPASAAFILLLILSAATAASAYRLGSALSVTLEGGSAYFSMHDVNSVIRASNAEVSNVWGGNGVQEAIDRGSFWNLALAARLTERAYAVLKLGRLSSSNKYKTGYHNTRDGSLGQLEEEVTVSGFPILIGGLYRWRLPGKNFYVVGGADGGILVDGRFREWRRIGSGGNSIRGAKAVKGSGMVLQAHLGGEWKVMPAAGVFVESGYRYARVGEAQWDEFNWFQQDASPYDGPAYVVNGILYGSDKPSGAPRMSIDFRGYYLGLGLRVYF